jgi:hypothetical protein
LKQQVLAKGALGVAGALGALVLYGFAIEPRFIDDNDFDVEIPGLPGAWEGCRVAAFADLQIGMWLANVDTMHRVVARANPHRLPARAQHLYAASQPLNARLRREHSAGRHGLCDMGE